MKPFSETSPIQKFSHHIFIHRLVRTTEVTVPNSSRTFWGVLLPSFWFVWAAYHFPDCFQLRTTFSQRLQAFPLSSLAANCWCQTLCWFRARGTYKAVHELISAYIKQPSTEKAEILETLFEFVPESLFPRELWRFLPIGLEWRERTFMAFVHKLKMFLITYQLWQRFAFWNSRFTFRKSKVSGMSAVH